MPVVASTSRLKDGLLLVWDKISGGRFLVETGMEVSIFPTTGLDTCNKQPGTHVPCWELPEAARSKYIEYKCTVCTHHPTTLCHKAVEVGLFIIAEASHSLLGANFLCDSSLLVNLHVKGKRLVDAETYRISLPHMQSRVPSAPPQHHFFIKQ